MTTETRAAEVMCADSHPGLHLTRVPKAVNPRFHVAACFACQDLAAALSAAGCLRDDREGETVTEYQPGPILDPTPDSGMDWRDGLDRLDALLNDCAQSGQDHLHHVRVQAVRHIVNAVRRYEDDTDESIRSALWEEGVANGEPWAVNPESGDGS